MPSNSTKDSILSAINVNSKQTVLQNINKRSETLSPKELSFPPVDFPIISDLIQPKQSSQNSFHELISSLSDDSQDTELFHRLSRQKEARLGDGKTVIGFESPGNDATSPATTPIGSANSSLNLSGLNLSSSFGTSFGPR
jgi:hypothetical protein